jgi:hypothetical protein
MKLPTKLPALETDVAVRFGQAPVLLSEYEGMVGRTRW